MIKIIRSMPAPASLAEESQKNHGSYNKEDVTKRLEEDFHNKCYICEIYPNADPQVEHRLPHMGWTRKERIFDWNNLFWACGHCNEVKNKHKYDGGILDCCNIDPEQKIHQYYENGLLKFDPLDQNEETLLTCELLKETYYQHNTGIRTSASNTRVKGAIEQINILLNSLNEYESDPKNKMIQKRLKVLLSRKSKYACFKRAYVRDHADKYPGLLKYLK